MSATFIEHDQATRILTIGTILAATAGEAIATYLGQRRTGDRSGIRGFAGSFAESAFVRNRGGASADRWTKQILVATSLLGLFAGWRIAKDAPSLRLGADAWPAFTIGLAVALAGVALRCWAVLTLGRLFRRVVAIDSDHTVVRSGPYHHVRHPAYTGNLLAAFGIALAFGSLVGAVACLALTFAGHLPRIHVEEAALESELGAPYRDYERVTARLVPGVW